MEPVTSSVDEEVKSLAETLERKTALDGRQICLYDGFWLREERLFSTIRAQRHFVAHDTDIILCTNPKCGTTWLKALTFSIVNRNVYPIHQSPVLTTNPQRLIPFLDINTYAATETPDIENIPSPRMFAVHIPYHSLPSSIRAESSKCRLIYICRNPLDQFTSYRHFLIENASPEFELPSLDEAFDMYCKGIYPYGPFWVHVSGYWKAHVDNPNKVLFIRYEDLKEDIVSQVKKIAEFIGMPFTEEEEEQGLVEQIVKLCSFENLKSLEVNKTESLSYFKNSSFFRKGKVGDWRNDVTPSMAIRFENILEAMLEGSGLKFKF